MNKLFLIVGLILPTLNLMISDTAFGGVSSSNSLPQPVITSTQCLNRNENGDPEFAYICNYNRYGRLLGCEEISCEVDPSLCELLNVLGAEDCE